MDNGLGGEFDSLIGSLIPSLETTFTIDSNIVSGGIYRFRFHA